MTVLSRVMWAAAVIVGVIVIVTQHIGYLHRRRPVTFGAFLETGGWIIITLVALAAVGGGMTGPSTRVVEVSAAIVGALFIGLGGQFK
jgi:hypothetical protein